MGSFASMVPEAVREEWRAKGWKDGDPPPTAPEPVEEVVEPKPVQGELVPPPERVAEGERRREEAIRRVASPAPAQAWVDVALRALRQVAESAARFTSDAVWDLLDEWGIEPPEEARAMGVVFRRAENQQVVIPSGDYELSSRPDRHRGPQRVWLSLVAGV